MHYDHKNGVRLRKVTRDDLLDLKRLKDESWFGTHRVAVLNMTDQEAWFERITASAAGYVLIAAWAFHGSHLPVGVFKVDGIDWQNRTANVGWDVYREHRGQGLGKKVAEAGVDFCFEVPNLRRLDCEVLANNGASQKCAEAAGMAQWGVRRQAVHRCGSFVDALSFGVLVGDWDGSPRVNDHRMSLPLGCCNTNYAPKSYA